MKPFLYAYARCEKGYTISIPSPDIFIEFGHGKFTCPEISVKITGEGFFEGIAPFAYYHTILRKADSPFEVRNQAFRKVSRFW